MLKSLNDLNYHRTRLTDCTAFMMGVLPSSSKLTQLGSALLPRASSMTPRFLAAVALYNRRLGSSLEKKGEN